MAGTDCSRDGRNRLRQQRQRQRHRQRQQQRQHQQQQQQQQQRQRQQQRQQPLETIDRSVPCTTLLSPVRPFRAFNNTGAGAVVIAFSTTDRASFDALPTWRRKVAAECGDIAMALVQNKVDLLDR